MGEKFTSKRQSEKKTMGHSPKVGRKNILFGESKDCARD